VAAYSFLQSFHSRIVSTAFYMQGSTVCILVLRSTRHILILVLLLLCCQRRQLVGRHCCQHVRPSAIVSDTTGSRSAGCRRVHLHMACFWSTEKNHRVRFLYITRPTRSPPVVGVGVFFGANFAPGSHFRQSLFYDICHYIIHIIFLVNSMPSRNLVKYTMASYTHTSSKMCA